MFLQLLILFAEVCHISLNLAEMLLYVDEFLAEGPGVLADAASANQSLAKKNILGKHVTPGGVVSSYKSVRACNDDLERGRIQREIETAKLDVLAKRKVALEAREKADREVAKRRELEAHIDKLKGDIQRLQGHAETDILLSDDPQALLR